jgi:hypothetical protein
MSIKHLEVKRAYYNDPDNVVVEVADGDVWHVCRGEPTWLAECYRIKPRTIRIGEIDVPEPVRVALNVGETYYIVQDSAETISMEFTWASDSVDNRLLSRGLIHLTREAAELHAKALITISGGKINE